MRQFNIIGYISLHAVMGVRSQELVRKKPEEDIEKSYPKKLRFVVSLFNKMDKCLGDDG
ncbi:MAG: hypothetical protein UX80_C0003G0021 [Candidatus Amesbacteria bacterium GW2011_GWA2_47_11b]|uniref:Uncharacterized protein n=2 Tax=Candidatus Amesiibacteriota TaxID=1752730 RepID=A0A0G1SLA5_9BACT|nr:MAG: hypothetical protein UX42_C0014G0007 [Microgenomates group bacterium GW2011_GWC1_46_20]KKU58366.1 MAG: hypothetical protein UX80_C0003G0021 [Candidatus Amesbacteria bacterium GW2011_GWA2_47_11b]KKU70186.1 MAG: hypothetical protein UX92_C0003G0006 [Candidatus Amesbacteria bacterium GW2011_GWA1_47_20]